MLKPVNVGAFCIYNRLSGNAIINRIRQKNSRFALLIIYNNLCFRSKRKSRMKCIYKILAAWPNKQKVLFWNERPGQMIWQNGLIFSKKCIYQCAFTVTVTIIYDLFAYDNNMVYQLKSLLLQFVIYNQENVIIKLRRVSL